ncbi:MAG: hypothetical protein E7553_00535 [Ruminococcaceae bacterium]|nr:hypothetical protein [Oscillospiraceae bacterium]
MKRAVLDFSGCQYLNELHERIQAALEFPDYYGKNLDAFWDCINRDCDIDFVTIKGCADIAGELKSTVEKILTLFEKNKQYWANSDCPFDYEVVS